MKLLLAKSKKKKNNKNKINAIRGCQSIVRFTGSR